LKKIAVALLAVLLTPLFVHPEAPARPGLRSVGVVAQAAPAEEVPPDEERVPPTTDADGYLQNGWLIWEELLPAGWDPAAIFEALDLNSLADDDPKAEKVVEEFLKKWNEAPINPAVDGRAMKIPGFVVPLDFEAEKLDEFFLVPFFGACIHVPPPPPNQIILVRSRRPLEGVGTMDVVWTYGHIKAEKVDTDLGKAGYSMAADRVEVYQERQDGEGG
jgi:hypothetical protein